MKILIIGAGPAGMTVAETLRQYTKANEIVMLSQEPFPPYSPPAMVEYFLTGAEAHLWKWRDAPEHLNLDYRPDRKVIKIIPYEHKVVLADNSYLPYDLLVIASGSSLYSPIQGTNKSGIFNFKSLSSAQLLIAGIKKGEVKETIIVGAGFIGLEIALLLNSLGVKVTILEMTDTLMPSMLDKETSSIAINLLKKRGIVIRFNSKAITFHGHSQAEGVELESGEVLKADCFIQATGVRPNTDFLDGSGINTRWGIVVDEFLRTNVPSIYAAGDVVETKGRIIQESSVQPIFPNAIAQGQTVAAHILGLNIPYEGADRMNSLKHLGLPIIAAGYKQGEVLRSQNSDTVRTVYLLEGKIVGFQLAGNIKGAGLYRTLMNKGVNVEGIKERLMEENFGLGYLTPF